MQRFFARRCRPCSGRDRAQVTDGVEEARATRVHDEVDRVVVSLAAEAASEVRPPVHRGVERATLRTAEGESRSSPRAFDAKLVDDGRDRHAVAKTSKFIA